MDEQKNQDSQDQSFERYGVWVKAGPEEVLEADEDFSISDLPAGSEDDEMDLEDLGDLDTGAFDAGAFDTGTFDTDDLGDLDSDELTLDDPVPGGPVLDGPESLEDEDDDGLVSLDDLDLEEPDEEADPFETFATGESPDAAGVSATAVAVPADGATEPDAGEDLDLDELNDSLGDDYENLGFDEEITLDDSFTIDGGIDEDVFDSSMPGSDQEIEEISLEDIDDIDTSETLTELDAETTEETEETEDREHDFTPEDQGIEIVPEGLTNTISPDEEEFLLADEEETPEDLQDTGVESADLQNGAGSAIPFAMDPQEREAFERIQNELSDIKRELAELKAVLRESASSPITRDAPAGAPAVKDTTVQDDQEESLQDDFGTADLDSMESESERDTPTGTGFFEEDEDETIALTGDELDNILNTAEFTEEAGEAEELDDDFLVTEEEETTGRESPSNEMQESTEETSDEEPFFEVDVLGEDDDNSQRVADINMEEADQEPFVITGDETAVDELADMNIDEELADIESLTDDSEADDEMDEIELDLDAIDGIDTVDEPTVQPPPAEDSHAGDQTEEDEIELDLDDLDVTAEDLDDQFGDAEESVTGPDLSEEGFDEFAAAVESDLAEPETDESDDGMGSPEPDAGIDLDEDFDADFELESGTEELDTTMDPDEEEPTLEVPHEEPRDELETPEEPSPPEEPSEPALSEPDMEADDEPEVPDTMAEAVPEAETAIEPGDEQTESRSSIADLPEDLKHEIRSVLSYMDQLLEALPDDKIEEFAQSEHFEVYKHLFEELGLET